MKRVRNIVIGGIQSKIFNLILLTVLLLTAANGIVYLYHSRMLSGLVSESGERQQEAISGITAEVMDDVVSGALQRSNQAEAKIADELFAVAADRVSFVAEYLEGLYAHPEEYEPQPYAGPDASKDGVWTAKVIYADDADPDDPDLKERIGLTANMSDLLILMCRSFGAASMYIALPEGVHFTVGDISSNWFEDGAVKSYDPRQRRWYQQAVLARELIFTEGEWDANTGEYCIECAAPVYGPDGSLAAVAGCDLFLDEMQEVMRSSAVDGEFQLLIGAAGHAVLAPQAESFPMAAEDREKDLRESASPDLAKIADETLQGKETGVRKGELTDGGYYLTASPIGTTGWVLLSAFSQEIAGQPAELLREQNRQIQAEAVEIYQDKTAKSRLTALVLLAAAAVLMLAGALVLGKRIVNPLNRVTRRIADLSETDLEFKMEDAYRTGDEVEELASSFAAISHKTVEYLEAVKSITAEKERISTELSLAIRIQKAMLPHIFPPFPDRSDFDIFASMDPAREVGGDFFDYFLIDDDHLCMVIADVSGKGVPAALFMMASKIILKSIAMLGQSPAAILSRTNEAICSDNDAQMFVTVWLGILELSTGKLTAANAGHEYPVLKEPDGGFALIKDRHGFVIGGLEGSVYREYELQMEPGSKLFVYTDGVAEASNGQGELFGTERLVEALNAHADEPPRDILEHVRKAVDSFVMNAEQFDDLTMLCLTYKGTGQTD